MEERSIWWTTTKMKLMQEGWGKWLEIRRSKKASGLIISGLINSRCRWDKSTEPSSQPASPSAAPFPRPLQLGLLFVPFWIRASCGVFWAWDTCEFWVHFLSPLFSSPSTPPATAIKESLLSPLSSLWVMETWNLIIGHWEPWRSSPLPVFTMRNIEAQRWLSQGHSQVSGRTWYLNQASDH